MEFKGVRTKKDYEKIVRKWFCELTRINHKYLQELGVKEPLVKASVDAMLTGFLFIEPRITEAITSKK